jgi:glycerol-3-phosphate acyltransferase PlsY
MSVLAVVLGYLIGSIPTAYIAAQLKQAPDIRQFGDGNVGGANAYREMGLAIGVTVTLIDVVKGTLAVAIAYLMEVPEAFWLLTGVAVVIGHNWPIFLGFHGGRGLSTTIGVLLGVVTVPMLILTIPALLALKIWHSPNLMAAIWFVPLSLLCWLGNVVFGLGISGLMIIYSVGLPCLVGATHYLRTNRRLQSA